MSLQKGHKESFALFFEEPSREGLRELLKQDVGETRFMDFKQGPEHASLAKYNNRFNADIFCAAICGR